MIKISFYRLIMSAKNCLNEHFCKFKTWYVVLLNVAVVGIIVGLVTGLKIAPDSSISKMPDSILRGYIEGNVSIFGVFFSRFFSLLGIMLLIWATNCKPFLCFVSLLALVYQSFSIGATIAFLITLFNVGGILNVIFIVIPFHLLFLFVLMGWTCVCVGYNFECKNFGGNIFSRDFICNARFTFALFVCLMLLGVFLEALLLPWFASAIIIG